MKMCVCVGCVYFHKKCKHWNQTSAFNFCTVVICFLVIIFIQFHLHVVGYITFISNTLTSQSKNKIIQCPMKKKGQTQSFSDCNCLCLTWIMFSFSYNASKSFVILPYKL